MSVKLVMLSPVKELVFLIVTVLAPLDYFLLFIDILLARSPFRPLKGRPQLALVIIKGSLEILLSLLDSLDSSLDLSIVKL